MEDTLPESENTVVEPIPDDPLKEIKAKLAHFLLALIQAFLRTGYYTPDHPQSKKARIGLYEDFKNLFTQKDELTFLVRDDEKEKKLLIEGVLAESHPLEEVMIRGMAELYTPKFAKFLERKDLISLTLKNSMTRTEFTNFVDVMSDSSFVDTQEKSDKERFSRTLQDKGIFNISYIFSEELLAARRKIPWRSQIALSRLNKDFRTIPLFLDLDEEGFKKVRRQIIQDITRPIQNSEIVYPILMNTDLAETKEFKESEIDDAIIVFLSDELLFKLSKILLREKLHQKEPESHQGKLLVIARKLASSLNLREIKGREPILEEYFKHKLIPLELLSAATQQKTKLEQLTNKFLRHRDSFFTQFDKIQDKEKYIRAARSCKQIIPELIRRDRYGEILAIISHIDRHFKEEKQVSVYAGQVLQEIVESDIPQALKANFLTGQKEIREGIGPILLKLHTESVPLLLSVFRESDDQLVRKDAWDILMQIDSSAINYILDELNKEETATESTIDIIRILGEINCGEWIEPVSKTLRAYLNHENPHLREEALWVYYKLIGGKGEKLYLTLLDDPDIHVQKVAIQCLGKIKSETALKGFIEVLEKAGDSPSDIDMRIESRIFSTLGSYGNVELPGGGSLENFLLQTLDHRLGLGPLKFLKKKENLLSEAAIVAICETLGTIGTNKSRGILQKLEKQHDSLWKDKAQEALEKIGEREESENSIETG
ncbi:MAG: HEAT repeat domain-containing protein [Deltaproteobacteria bacterium]|nr:HEAT repeat domain-containing protein [Deltaproteobacteria bacterium]